MKNRTYLKRIINMNLLNSPNIKVPKMLTKNIRHYRKYSATLLLLCAATLLSSCQTTSSQTGKKDEQAKPGSAKEKTTEQRQNQQAETEPQKSLTEALPEAQGPKAQMLDESPLKIDELVPDKRDGQKQSIQFPEKAPEKERPEKKRTEYPENLIKGIKAPDETVDVTLNFDATPLSEVVPLFAELLDFSYMIDPQVKGAVTMTLESKMSAREVWELFEHVLWLSGSYASRNPGFIHILPFKKMPRERNLLSDKGPLANVRVEMFQLDYAQAGKIVSHLKPFLTTGATVQTIDRMNSLLVVEDPDNMDKIRLLIDKLDKKGEAAWPNISLQCEKVPAEKIVEELTSLLPVMGLQVTSKMPSKGQIKIIAIPRLQAIVASAPVPEALEKVKKWVEMLDRKDARETENIYFYNVQHSTAERLADALKVFFSESVTKSRQSPSESRSTSRRAEEDSNSNRSSNRGGSGSSNFSTAGDKDQEKDNVFNTPIVVYASGEQNRLTIRTTPRAYSMVEALLNRLDSPTRQVAIQAYIAEITLTKSTEFGFAYAAKQKFNDYEFTHGMNNTSIGIPFQGDSIGDSLGTGTTLLLQNLADKDKLAFIKAVAGKGNTHILSAPQIVAANDEEAKIQVGKEIPTVSGDISDTTGDADTVRRDIQYRDTGTMLTVTPHITAGNEVRLEIEQEVSDVATSTADTKVQQDTPTISQKNLSSVLVVPDGGTVLMGGLIKNTSEESHDGIPILKDIPILGYLFKQNINSNRRTELLVLMSVRVIEDQTSTESFLKRYDAAVEEIRKRMDL